MLLKSHTRATYSVSVNHGGTCKCNGYFHDALLFFASSMKAS